MKSTKKIETPLHARQGDVLFLQVPSIPADAVEVPLHSRGIVIAEGEVTGHAHCVAEHTQTTWDDAGKVVKKQLARLLQAPDGNRYLRVDADVRLGHEEHKLVTTMLGNSDGTTTIPAGNYILPRQVEYTAAELRRVAD